MASFYSEQENSRDNVFPRCRFCNAHTGIELVDVIRQQDTAGTRPVWYCNSCRRVFDGRTSSVGSMLTANSVGYMDGNGVEASLNIDRYTTLADGRSLNDITLEVMQSKLGWDFGLNEVSEIKKELEKLRQEVQTRALDPLTELRDRVAKFKIEV